MEPKGMQQWVRVRLSLWCLQDSRVKAQKLDIVVWISGQKSELEIKTCEFPYLAVFYSLHCYFCTKPRITWKNSHPWPLCCYYLALLWIPVLHSIPWSFKMVFCPCWEEVNLQLSNLNTDNSEERICQECPCIHPRLRQHLFLLAKLITFGWAHQWFHTYLRVSVATRQVFLSSRSLVLKCMPVVRPRGDRGGTHLYSLIWGSPITCHSGSPGLILHSHEVWDAAVPASTPLPPPTPHTFTPPTPQPPLPSDHPPSSMRFPNWDYRETKGGGGRGWRRGRTGMALGLHSSLTGTTLILSLLKLRRPYKISFEDRVLMLKTSLQTIAFYW